MSIAEHSPGITWAGMTLRTIAPTGNPDWFVLVRDVVGWWNGAPVASQPIDHWAGDGQLEQEERLGARTVEVVGTIVAKSGHLFAAQDALTRRRRGLFVVDELEMGRAKMSSAVRAEPVRYTHISENVNLFSMFLRMADPLRYGTTTRVLGNGSQSIANAGDEDSHPTLTLTGPHDALVITHPDGAFHLDALGSGVTRVIDFRNGDVWNGQTRVHGTSSGEQAVVRAGGSTWNVSGLGAGTATLSRFEAWS